MKTKTQPQNNSKPNGLSGVQTASRKLPSRMILHASEKWGKTSFAAQAPSPIFLQSKGETGLEALMDSGLIGDVPHWPEAQSFKEILDHLDELIEADHDRKTLIIDTGNGVSRLLEERVCRSNFAGDWNAYNAWGGTGEKDCVEPWQREFLARLDTLRERKRMAIIMLCHSKVKTFRNPLGNDYDRFEVDMPRGLWEPCKRWADLILFGDYLTTAEKEKGSSKAKGKGGEIRMLRTERTAAYDAGNRHGLPPVIDCSEGPEAAWREFITAMKGEQK